jgi:hypothetical protein
MTTSCTRALCLAVFLLASLPAAGQDVLGQFLQTGVSLNYPVAPTYSHNFSLSQRYSFLDPVLETRGIRHLELAHFSSFKWGASRSFGIGILYRFREWFDGSRADELRITEQLNFVSEGGVVRTGHRLRAEQRIFSDIIRYRFRYRLALDGPLQGQSLNLKELYWVGTLEGLFSAGEALRPLYGIRPSAYIGYLASEQFRIQIGAEYRQEDLGRNNIPILFFLTSLILNL